MEILVYSCSLKVFAPKKSKLAVITGVMVPAFFLVLCAPWAIFWLGSYCREPITLAKHGVFWSFKYICNVGTKEQLLAGSGR